MRKDVLGGPVLLERRGEFEAAQRLLDIEQKRFFWRVEWHERGYRTKPEPSRARTAWHAQPALAAARRTVLKTGRRVPQPAANSAVAF